MNPSCILSLWSPCRLPIAPAYSSNMIVKKHSYTRCTQFFVCYARRAVAMAVCFARILRSHDKSMRLSPSRKGDGYDWWMRRMIFMQRVAVPPLLSLSLSLSLSPLFSLSCRFPSGLMHCMHKCVTMQSCITIIVAPCRRYRIARIPKAWIIGYPFERASCMIVMRN